MSANAWQGIFCFGLSGALAIYLGFFFERPDVMVLVQGQYGYHAAALTVAFLAAAIGQALWHQRARLWALSAQWISRHGAALLLVVAVVAVALWLEPPKVRILADEARLLGTSLTMHETRDNLHWAQGLYLHGQGYEPIQLAYDKRAPGYPYLLSLIHDLTGYRIANAYAFNAIGGALALLLVYLLGSGRGDRLQGVLAMAALSSFPVFWYSVSSAGFEIWNLALILAGIQAVLSLDRARSWDGVVLLTAIAALLGQFRYESILLTTLFLLIAVIRLPWRRLDDFPWLLILAPLALVGTAWQVFVPFDPEVARDVTAFSVGNLISNAVHALRFFLGPSGFASPLVLLLSLPGVVLWLRRGRAGEARIGLGARIIAIGLLVWTVVVWCYWHGNFEKQLTMRLSLPMLPFMAIGAALAMRDALRRAEPRWLGPSTVVLLLLGAGLALQASRGRTVNNASVLFNGVAGMVAERYPRQNLLLVTPLADWFAPLEVGAVSSGSFEANRDRFLSLLAEGKLDQILVIESAAAGSSDEGTGTRPMADLAREPVLLIESPNGAGALISRLTGRPVGRVQPSGGT